MGLSKKIYITGMGAVTPVGIGVDNFLAGLRSGKCGITPIEGLGDSMPPCFAGQIRDYNPRDYLPMRLVQDLEPFMQYAFIAAGEAFAQSGLVENSSRTGVIMGTALGGISTIGDTAVKYASAGKSAGPKFLTKAMGNIAAAQFAIAKGLRGPSMTVSTACSSGGDAVSLAALMLLSGAADAMVVMAGEAAICPTMIQSLLKTGALSKTGDCRPFDTGRNGFVLGEGGGALVLETEESVKARGIKPIAELLGFANNTDAYNPVSPHPEGMGASACMEAALECAGISPDAVDYINAHGTATHMGDVAESLAIGRVFGGRDVFVSSTKGATGHMMGAGGITELIACCLAIRESEMPVSLGLSDKDPECPINVVTPENKNSSVNIAMSNAFGFGGQNSCVIVGKTNI
ncbi:MAG: beta-ketoacyl-[acyl-carrier-protein] synthase family protein [Oscillospiraceae bacterium]|nr:beta-ketoacyl-[acyl-carrier-protein] synthase family protein [Oscillospiraceae bacterium]